MEDGRPAGGTARQAPGNKTPRKVQWVDTGVPDAGESSHELDEHGNDPHALKEFIEALERHQSEKRPPRVHYFPPPKDDPRFTGPSKHVDLPPIDTSDSVPRIYHSHSSGGTSTATTVSTDTSPASTRPGSPVHDRREVPGQFIGQNETAGLPSTQDPDESARKAANRVVRQHTRKRAAGLGGKGFGSWWGGGASSSATARDKGKRSQSPASKDKKGGHTPVLTKDFASSGGNTNANTRLLSDVEKEGQSSRSFAPRGMGGGVLSALLALYNESDLPSGYSTPANPSSARSSFDEGGRLPEKPWMQQQPKPQIPDRAQIPPQSSSSAPPELSKVAEQPSTSTLLTSSSTAIVDHGTSSGHGKSGTGSGSKTPPKLKLPNLFNTEAARPIAARNAGGVVGSLIASTGNISGAAAPKQSQIAPNVKRPGYHLSRYSYDDKANSSSSSSGGVSPDKSKQPLSRPKSMQFELSGAHLTPGGAEHSGAKSTPSTPGSTSPTGSRPSTPGLGSGGANKARWSGAFKDLPTYGASILNEWVTPRSTPGTLEGDSEEWLSEKHPPALASVKTKDKDRDAAKKRKRKKAEIYITRHVAQILQRQEFICKLARTMMMYGAPSHRLQPQIQTTARVLEIDMSCIYLPDLMLLSFDDSVTSTSSIRFIRQTSGLDLWKLGDAYDLYWRVIHDETSVSEASTALDNIMRKRPFYRPWQLVLIGGMCSASICTVSFSGSFIDALLAFPMGAMLVAIQLISVRNELYSNIFEITVATLFSFLSAALASTNYFCYPALASSSVVLILPGFIVLCGSLELVTRNIIAGSVRLCYAVVYSLFLGFGLAMGAEAFEKITNRDITQLDDLQCSSTHHDGKWWLQTPSQWWAFLTVPMFSLFLSMRNFAPINELETLLLVGISCVGWVTNHFVSTSFQGRSDISAAVGAFAVGLISNIYARFFSGNAFVIMITGILFQVPSGLGNGGLLTYVQQQSEGNSSSYVSGFQTALQLISVAIGLAIGLSISLFVVHPIQSRRLRGGVFSL